MAIWTFEIDLSKEFRLSEQSDKHYRTLLNKILCELDRVKLVAWLENTGRQHIAQQVKTLVSDIKMLTEDPAYRITDDEVDEILTDLYDIGDISLDGKFNGRNLMFVRSF